MRLLPRWKHIYDLDHPSDIYLSRLMLVKLPWIGVYLHVIRRPDYARCQHDHPWSFITLILRGGYEEQVGAALFARRPGYIGYRPRTFEHRITKLFATTALTLVVRFRNHETWGFRTLSGAEMSWQRYVAAGQRLRVLWCDDSEKAR